MNSLKKTLAWVAGQSFIRIVLAGVLLTVAIIFWNMYKQQVLSYLPYLFLLLCPLMHIFMHRAHHGPSRQAGEQAQITDHD